MGYSVQVGDMIRINRVGYSHVGIYVGERFVGGQAGNIVHNDKFGGVVLSTLEQFAGGALVNLHKPATGDYFEREAIANRAIFLIGKEFDLLAFNCEHAANWAQNGKAESPQLQGALFLAVFVGLLAVLAGSE